ncbi:uncharacterized protein LOC131595028 [Vicia villosa]|uniref:uncharacterized protein LOC131595028 n=1 Tax=Vicia villosa TaxID=3911 RepID=UPI00273C2087|nr:uncharacterized protein LOC131595028 [Vicia villosa]
MKSLLSLFDSNCMNELEAAIQRLNATMKKFIEEEDVRYTEYTMLRTTDALRLDRVEEQLVALQVSSASNGDLDSSLQYPENQLQEEIDASDLLDVEVLTTPYTTVEITLLEVLRETLLVVNASDVRSNRVIEPSISVFNGAPRIKGFIPSTGGHDCNSKENTTFDVDNKRLKSSPVIISEDFNIVRALTLPTILLSDPTDIVSIPPPPLAPPWLHRSLYSRSLKSPPSSKVNNLPLYFQFEQKNLFGTQSHCTPTIGSRNPSVYLLKCSSSAYTNIVSSCEAHNLFVKMPNPCDFSCVIFRSLLSMMQIPARVGQVDMDTANYAASSILFHNNHNCMNYSSSSGLVVEFGLISSIGTSSFLYDLMVDFACNSRETAVLLSQVYWNYNKEPNSGVRARNMNDLKFQKDASAFEFLRAYGFHVAPLWFCGFLNPEATVLWKGKTSYNYTFFMIRYKPLAYHDLYISVQLKVHKIYQIENLGAMTLILYKSVCHHLFKENVMHSIAHKKSMSLMNFIFFVGKMTFKRLCVVSKENGWRKVTVLSLRVRLLVLANITFQFEAAGIFSQKALGLDKRVNNDDEICSPVSAGFIKPEQLSDSSVLDNIIVKSTTFSMHYRSLASSNRIDVMMTSSMEFTVNKEITHQSLDVNTFTYGDNIGKIGKTDRSLEVHKRGNGDLLFVFEQTRYMRSEREKSGNKNWNDWDHILKKFSASTKQMLSKSFDKPNLRLIGMLENVLQQLQQLAPKPYIVLCLSYMYALSHDGDKKVVDLISFSLVRQQFNQWDPGGYSIDLEAI